LVLPGSATLLASLAGEPLRTAGPGKRKYQNKSYSDDFGVRDGYDDRQAGPLRTQRCRAGNFIRLHGLLCERRAGRERGLGGDDENRDLLPAMLQLPLELEPGHAPDGNVEE